jgi:hypothetical protein
MKDPEHVEPSITKPNGSKELESAISIFILCLLLAIGALIFLRQSSFDEKYFSASIVQPSQSSSETAADLKTESNAALLKTDALVLDSDAPNGFTPMSAEENFDSITLSDKIDGKADGYLQAGFVRLTCRRFVKKTNQEQWFEFYLYDMGLPRNAFSVYSSQKREGVTPRDFTEFAYSTENAVFFAQGKFYVEIISSVKDKALTGDLIGMSKSFVAKQAAGNVKLPELKYLPKENLDLGSISLISKNGFGYDKFDNIITATYLVQGKKILAFVSIRENAKNAEELKQGYDNTLSEFVGKERLQPETNQIPGLIIADVFGEYEMVFAKGNVVGGIHSAPDKSLGEEIAVRLYKQISGLIK